MSGRSGLSGRLGAAVRSGLGRSGWAGRGGRVRVARSGRIMFRYVMHVFVLLVKMHSACILVVLVSVENIWEASHSPDVCKACVLSKRQKSHRVIYEFCNLLVIMNPLGSHLIHDLTFFAVETSHGCAFLACKRWGCAWLAWKRWGCAWLACKRWHWYWSCWFWRYRLELMRGGWSGNQGKTLELRRRSGCRSNQGS